MRLGHVGIEPAGAQQKLACSVEVASLQDRPIAFNGQVVIRPMMYVALTYDHRLVDGREAVTFLKRIKQCMEEPARILLEV